MSSTSSHTSSAFGLERWLAGIACLLCLGVSAAVWLSLHTRQPLWPLPDLYLLEISAASSLAVWGLWDQSSSLRRSLAWACAGVTLGFAILAGFSIGFLYLPSAGLLALACFLADLRLGGRLVAHLGIWLAAAVLQAGLMLGVIRVLF